MNEECCIWSWTPLPWSYFHNLSGSLWWPFFRQISNSVVVPGCCALKTKVKLVVTPFPTQQANPGPVKLVGSLCGEIWPAAGFQRDFCTRARRINHQGWCFKMSRLVCYKKLMQGTCIKIEDYVFKEYHQLIHHHVLFFISKCQLQPQKSRIGQSYVLHCTPI